MINKKNPSSKLKIKENFFNLIRSLYSFIGIVVLNGERLNVFLLRLEARQGCPLSQLKCRSNLEVLTSIVRQEKETKDIKIGKKDVSPFLFTDNMIAYIQYVREFANYQN